VEAGQALLVGPGEEAVAGAQVVREDRLEAEPAEGFDPPFQTRGVDPP
jgi:hypothetical protein